LGDPEVCVVGPAGDLPIDDGAHRPRVAPPGFETPAGRRAPAECSAGKINNQDGFGRSTLVRLGDLEPIPAGPTDTSPRKGRAARGDRERGVDRPG